MNHYDYQATLKLVWDDAVAKYRAGKRDPEAYFDAATLADLASIGLKAMDVYDYAEDYVSGGDPDFETFLMVCEARRDYFLTEQRGQPSESLLDSSTLPPKTESTRGIAWLPRILPKALAKLRGELPPETMYGCGGDRRFFRENNIHPAEFLRATWAYQDDMDRLVDWVESRRPNVDKQGITNT
ncbi:MAG: DUF5069 domain-containing protein [Opitutales bacterium]